jgi:hypothetical protein
MRCRSLVHSCLGKYKSPLLSLVPPCLRFLSLMCLQSYSLPLSWCGAGKRPGTVAQRGHKTSGPLRGGPSGPRHGGATALTPSVMGGAAHERLPGGSSSLSQSCGHYLFAASRSCHCRPNAYNATRPLSLVNSAR